MVQSIIKAASCLPPIGGTDMPIVSWVVQLLNVMLVFDKFTQPARQRLRPDFLLDAAERDVSVKISKVSRSLPFLLHSAYAGFVCRTCN